MGCNKKLTEEESNLLLSFVSDIDAALHTSFRDWEIKHRDLDTVLYPDTALSMYIDLLRGLVTTDASSIGLCQSLEVKQRIRVIACTGDKVVVRVLGCSQL